MSLKKRYYPQINIIKAVASFSVTAVHFRNRVETLIPKNVITSKIQWFFSANYAAFIFAVPLFLLITGFLSINRKVSKKHYLEIFKIYLMYIFLAIIGHYLMVYIGEREQITLIETLQRVSNFKLVSGWYVEMYIGLALLIPYLNILIKNLNKKQFEVFLITLVLFVGLPAFTNANGITKGIFLPNYWKPIYPVVYYFLGAYFRLYFEEINIKKSSLILIWLVSMAAIFLVVRYNANPYTSSSDGYYASIIEIVLSSSFFLLIIKGLNNSNKILDFLSKYSLSTYIMAYPIDFIIHPKLRSILGGPTSLIRYAIPIVLICFVVTVISGFVFTSIFNFIYNKFKILNDY